MTSTVQKGSEAGTEAGTPAWVNRVLFWCCTVHTLRSIGTQAWNLGF